MRMRLTRPQLGKKHPQDAARPDRQIGSDPIPDRNLDAELFAAFPLQRNSFQFAWLHLAARQFPLPGERIGMAAFGREERRTRLAPPEQRGRDDDLEVCHSPSFSRSAQTP